jgi:hypothetical protein
MVTNSKQIVPGILLLVATAALIIWLMPNEKKAIRKQFACLSELARKNEDENLFVTLSKAKLLSELMTDPCELKGNIQPLDGTYSRQEAATAFAAIRAQFDAIALELTDLSIEFPEKGSAAVTLTARFKATGSRDSVSEVRELNCTLVKQDGKWLFNTCQTVDVFQK